MWSRMKASVAVDVASDSLLTKDDVFLSELWSNLCCGCSFTGVCVLHVIELTGMQTRDTGIVQVLNIAVRGLCKSDSGGLER